MMRIWITTTEADSASDRDLLKEILDMLHENYSKPFSAPAAHAAQTVSLESVMHGESLNSYQKASLEAYRVRVQ
jgi:hypothetical protein